MNVNLIKKWLYSIEPYVESKEESNLAMRGCFVSFKLVYTVNILVR